MHDGNRDDTPIAFQLSANGRPAESGGDEIKRRSRMGRAFRQAEPDLLLFASRSRVLMPVFPEIQFDLPGEI